MALKITILVPTVNEIDGMRAMMPRIKKEWYDQLIVVDGNSTDGTLEYAREHGYEVLTQKKKGIRRAYFEALEHVTGDIVIPFSPDGNSIPEVIPELIKKISEGYDMVIASRYMGGATSDDDGLITGFGNKLFTTMINVLHGGRYTDSMGMYRAWRKNLLFELDLHKEEGYVTERLTGVEGIGLEPLLSIRCAKRKMRVAEIPGSEPKRLGGTRKMQPFRWGSVLILQTLRELYFWR